MILIPTQALPSRRAVFMQDSVPLFILSVSCKKAYCFCILKKDVSKAFGPRLSPQRNVQNERATAHLLHVPGAGGI